MNIKIEKLPHGTVRVTVTQSKVGGAKLFDREFSAGELDALIRLLQVARQSNAFVFETTY